jgi:hypothetical protein
MIRIPKGSHSPVFAGGGTIGEPTKGSRAGQTSLAYTGGRGGEWRGPGSDVEARVHRGAGLRCMPIARVSNPASADVWRKRRANGNSGGSGSARRSWSVPLLEYICVRRNIRRGRPRRDSATRTRGRSLRKRATMKDSGTQSARIGGPNIHVPAEASWVAPRLVVCSGGHHGRRSEGGVSQHDPSPLIVDCISRSPNVRAKREIAPAHGRAPVMAQ